MKRWTVLFGCILLGGFAGAAPQTAFTSLPALKKAVYVDAASDDAVTVEATVVRWTSPISDIFYVTDGQDALRFSDKRAVRSPDFRPGDRVRIAGRTVRSTVDEYSCVYALKIELLSRGEPPQPVDVRAKDLNDGKFIDCLVRVKGTVIDAFRDEIDPRFAFLVLERDGEFLYATTTHFLGDGDFPSTLVGAEISMVGLCTKVHPKASRNQIDIEIAADSDRSISVIKPPPPDPFDVPELDGTIRTLARPATFRRKLRGTVIAAWHGDSILVQSANEHFSKVQLLSGALPAYGDVIEAVGVPESDLYGRNLSRALWRPASTAAIRQKAPLPVSVKSLLMDEQDRPRFLAKMSGQPIRVTGTVRALPDGIGGDGRLLLSEDGHTIPVDFSSVPAALAGLEVGCTLDVSGTCVMETENWRPQMPFPRIRGCFLAVRTPADVRILSRPSWWTPGRLLVVIGILLAAFLVVLLRNILLSRLARVRIAERTRLAVELHDTLAQNLMGASFEINTAEQLTASDPSVALGHLGRASRTLKSCRDELRNCIWDLRNRTLEEKEMAEAIRKTLEPHVGDTRLSIRFNVPRQFLSDNSTHAILRIIRELTLNARRHGHATAVRIAGTVDNGKLLFSVADDGLGFDPQTCPGVRDGHFGLQGIRERVREFNGEVRWESAPGRGAKAVVSLLLPRIGKI